MRIISMQNNEYKFPFNKETYYAYIYRLTSNSKKDKKSKKIMQDFKFYIR